MHQRDVHTAHMVGRCPAASCTIHMAAPLQCVFPCEGMSFCSKMPSPAQHRVVGALACEDWPMTHGSRVFVDGLAIQLQGMAVLLRLLQPVPRGAAWPGLAREAKTDSAGRFLQPDGQWNGLLSAATNAAIPSLQQHTAACCTRASLLQLTNAKLGGSMHVSNPDARVC